MIARPASIFDWVSQQVQAPSAQNTEPSILTELAKTRTANALAASGENVVSTGEVKDTRKNAVQTWRFR